MKKIKLILLINLSVMCFAYAQQETTKQSPLKFGIKAGFNIANTIIDGNGAINNKKAIPGWQLGIITDVPLLPILSLQPGLFLNSKGSKFTIGDNQSSNYTEVSIHPLYLEVPVNLVFKLPLLERVNLFAGAGPYAAIGLAGKSKTKGKLLGTSFSDENSIEYGNDDPGAKGTYQGDLKRFDFGFNLLAGVEINRFMVNVNYGYGLVNIKPGSANDDSKYQNRVASLLVGFLF